MTISDLGYELYKNDWLRRISAEIKADAIKNYYQEKELCSLADYIFETGYDGQIYVCKDEFLDIDYLYKGYMKALYGNDELYAEYLADLKKRNAD